jgi:hypothetical protein
MDKPRWWHIAVSVMTVVLTVMVGTAGISVERKIGAIIALAVFARGGGSRWAPERSARRCRRWSSPGCSSSRSARAVSFYPVMAILQCVAYPAALG